MAIASRKTVTITLLLAAAVLAAGCTDAGTGGPNSIEGVPDAPNASDVELPSELETQIEGTLSQNATLVGYSSTDSMENIERHYGTRFSGEGWEEVQRGDSVDVWKKGEEGVGVSLFPAQLVSGQVNVSESAQTVIVVMKDDFAQWRSALVGIRGTATLTNGTITFTPETMYPDTIPASEYRYQVQTVDDGAANGIHPNASFTPGPATLENGEEITLEAEDSQVGDILVFEYEGSVYNVWVRGPDGSIGTQTAPGTTSPHG